MIEAVVGLLATISFFGLLGIWFWFQWSHRELLRTAAKLPLTMPTVPFLGHAYLALRGIEDLAHSILKMSVGAIGKGVKTACFWAGPIPLVFVLGIDDIRILLSGTNTSDRADEYDLFITGMDSGVGPVKKNILSAQGTEWKVRRKQMNTMFHPHNVQRFMPVLNVNSRELVDRISHHLGHGPFNVLEYTMECSLKSICNLVFGPKVLIDVNAEAFKGILVVLESIPELLVRHLILPWLRIEFVYRLVYRSKLKQLNNLWRRFVEAHLNASREHQKQKKLRDNIFNVIDRNENSRTEENRETINFLDVYTDLQKNYPEFTEADFLCDMMTLFATGTDTVGLSTANCLLALAQYQDIQDRLYREISSVVGPDDDVTLEDLSRMPYLDMVVKETLRRFLIVPFICRKLIRDVTFSECRLPAGSPVLCCLAAVHMDPKIYPNPKEFDPERFSPENSAAREKFEYLAFSSGPRNCIAKTYAMQFMKIMVIHVLRKYRLSTTQDVQNLKLKLIVVLVSSEGYNISLESRNPDKDLVKTD